MTGGLECFAWQLAERHDAVHVRSRPENISVINTTETHTRPTRNPLEVFDSFARHVVQRPSDHAIMPFRTAYSTISAVLCRFNFCIRLARCVSTVDSPRSSRVATSLFDRPSASSCSTSFSRSVSKSYESVSPLLCNVRM